MGFNSNNNVVLSAVGTLTPYGENAQNWYGVANWNGTTLGNLTDVGTAGGPSAYGTYDQSALVEEHLEDYSSTTTTINMRRHFGSYDDTVDYLKGTLFAETAITATAIQRGFRVATIENFYNLPNFVRVGDPGNAPDSAGNGAVNYWFRIGRYHVTNNDYIQYLRAIASVDVAPWTTSNVYRSDMGTNTLGGITRTQTGGSGANTNYSYALKANFANKPINFVSWQMAARYCNWLHNGRPSGAQNASTTEDGAYDMALSIPVRKSGARYYLPNRNEWVKAGFYKGGSISAGYWIYSTQCNVLPMAVAATSTGVGLTPQAVLSNLGLRNERVISFAYLSGQWAIGFATNNSTKLLLSSVSVGDGVTNFSAGIYSDNNGLPGTVLYTSFGSKYIGNGADGNKQSRAYFKNAILQPNTIYWISTNSSTWSPVFNSNSNTIDPPVMVNNSGYSFVGVAQYSISTNWQLATNPTAQNLGIALEASATS